ncbi:NUDIX hydrolase domain-like protein [Panaeolus papilionaceus]|nr:NUDIX hydrolase domain-like protein [Panaeolus papilionaceus]
MAASPYPTTQALAGGFVISAGCILFRIQDELEDEDNYTPPQASAASRSDSDSGFVNAHVNAGNDQRSPTSSTTVNDHEGAGADTRSEPAGVNRIIVTSHEQQKEPEQKVEVCILHHLKRDEWLLPKGRKDRGESTEAAALRETYEETGYPCQLWALRMPTRAPPPGALGDAPSSHKVQVVEGLREPIAITTRTLGKGLGIKLIFWYVARVEGKGVKEENTQMPNESFESVFVSPEDALSMLTFENDREVVRCAVGIVRDNLAASGDSSGGVEGMKKESNL